MKLACHILLYLWQRDNLYLDLQPSELSQQSLIPLDRVHMIVELEK